MKAYNPINPVVFFRLVNVVRLFSFVCIGTVWMLIGMFLYHVGIANPLPFSYMVNYETVFILAFIAFSFALPVFILSFFKGQAGRQLQPKKNLLFPIGYVVVKTDLIDGYAEPVAWFVSGKNRDKWIEQQQKVGTDHLYQWHWATDYNNNPPPTEKTTYFRYKDQQQARQ